MGKTTQNAFFYLPDYGAFGETEKNLFDAALDNTDGIIKIVKDKTEGTVGGNIPRYTTDEIQAIVDAGTSSDVRVVFNTTRNALELWVGFSFAKIL